MQAPAPNRNGDAPPRRPSAVRWATIIAAALCLVSTSTCVATNSPSNSTNWWAFETVRPTAVPTPNGAVPTNPIDAFVRARLDDQGLAMNPEARPAELVRRLWFDLVGLPPTPEAIARFERDPSPSAWAREVDALLASPRYGERWGRHWLDVARFAQSNGYERDAEKAQSWRYRDYVIRAFNQDTPYDRFIREQLAGDEIGDELREPDGTIGQAWQDGVIATGFLRLGVHDDEPDDKLQAEFDELDDIVSTSGSAFLGLTVGCARCHDHKFDPIPQEDYYSLLSVFRPLRTIEPRSHGLDSPLFAPLAGPEQVAAWRADQQRQQEALEARKAAAKDEATRKSLSEQIATIQKQLPPFEWALAARERTQAIPTVQVLARGNPRSPGTPVNPGTLRAAGGGALSVNAPTATASSTPPPTSGRRRALADWIANPSNPLTARVMVNRVWHHHFGRGLVRTTTDFGRVGSLPSHPELLDWLAADFIRNGWSVKALHRRILTSATWKQSSAAESQTALSRDPGNELLWRQNLRRLDAEALRDSLLAISGELNLDAGGRGFFPALSGEVLAGGSRPGTDWEVSSTSDRARRSVYAYVRRTSMVPLFETFDYNNATSPISERPTTTVPTQALMLLNDAFVHEQAEALATAVMRESGATSTPETLDLIWQRATGRHARAEELQALEQFRDRQESLWCGLAQRLVVTPDVPDTLSTPYFGALPADRFVLPPGPGWQSHKGWWPREYEGNKALEAGRGPYVLRTDVATEEGEFTADLIPQVSCTQVGLLWRVVPAAKPGEAESGLELVIEPREGRARIRRVFPEGEETLARAENLPLLGDRIPLRLVVGRDRCRVFLNGTVDPLLEASLPAAAPATGGLGLRAWGAAASLDRAQWTAGGSATPLWNRHPDDWARRKALESVCRMVLNLNEVAYVD
ncbi:MAG: DUF1549 and DUF1553 domain-containing protein [Limisphaerales bacterium]